MAGSLRLFLDKTQVAPAVEVIIDEEELAAADANGAAAEIIFGAIGDFTVRAIEAGHAEQSVAEALELFEQEQIKGRQFRAPPK